jgi:hypothetical protein
MGKPMTDDVHATATELDQRLFELVSCANRPDIIWDEDGHRWGQTFDDAECAALNADLDAAERALDDFLVQHRAELAGDRANVDVDGADESARRRRDERAERARDSRPSSTAAEPPTGPGWGRQP